MGLLWLSALELASPYFLVLLAVDRSIRGAFAEGFPFMVRASAEL